MDERVKGKLYKKLRNLAGAVLNTEDFVDPGTASVKKTRGAFKVPDCGSCEDRCCVHKKPEEGILLSLWDIATLVDSGLEDFIVGRYTFEKKHGHVLPEVDKLPRLKKRNGNCIFYEEQSGRCTQYGLRPTICRRFPYEVHYKSTKRREIPIVRFMSGLPCPTISISDDEDTVQQYVADTVHDENISLEDDLLLPIYHKQLRKMGFGPYLPGPKNCPP